MRASLIIPTYNGAYQISNLLESLANQTVKDFEVIIVIDGSTDNTEEVVKPYKKKFASFKVISQENKGRSITRNEGALRAQTDILIFCDSDMLPQRDSISKHLDFHTNYPGCLLSGNPMEISSTSNSEIQNYKAYISEKWLSKYIDGISLISSRNLFFTAANCSLPKKIFKQLKGFDERLTDVEDFDLAFRALNENINVYFDKSNVSIHNDRITCNGYIKRLREYAAAKQQWNRIHLNNSPLTLRSGLKKILYFPLSSRYWINAVDKNFFWFFPRRIRYKLYDLIIQALAVEFPKATLS